MKTIHQSMIEQFMRGARQFTPEKPCLPDAVTRLLRARLIMEETLETIEKGLGFYVGVKGSLGIRSVNSIDDIVFSACHSGSLIETADGCADLSVVTVGTLSACGIQDYPLFLEVDRNNLDKLARGTIREDGKLVKPPDHKPPDIAGVLKRQK